MPKQHNNLNDNLITTTRVSGANELKIYIKEITALANEIRQEFENSLEQPSAIVEYRRTRRSTHDFNAEMSRVSHCDFVYNNTKLPQSSKIIQADGMVIECLRLLETLRKMLVSNKQQKKTTVRNIRGTINQLKKHQQQWVASLKPEVELEAKVSSPFIERLENVIEMTKQNHHTITNRLMEQVNTLVLAMRRNILAFKLSMENTIGEIIHHAEKCRAFIAKCRRIELVEFCASVWWFESEYSAVIAQHPELSEIRLSISVILPKANDRPKIVVHVASDPASSSVCEYELDQSLTEKIITDEACREFENGL